MTVVNDGPGLPERAHWSLLCSRADRICHLLCARAGEGGCRAFVVEGFSSIIAVPLTFRY